ncbi:MAG: hypothetical protein JKY37_10355 [Nannocystaceae bacterium]|nr:hypothetical protein [Nannocystaceae bacterium]
MRAALVTLFAVLACDPKPDAAAQPTPAAVSESTGPASETGSEAPQEPPIDAARQFVKEDLDRFLAKYPDVVAQRHKTLMETCEGNACLEHGVSATVGPFKGVGTRYLVPLWLRGCLTGSAEACLLAGRTYQGSRFSSSDTPFHENIKPEVLSAKFRQYIALACKLSEAHCNQWADYTLGDEAPSKPDVARAIERLRDLCGHNDHSSCAALARHASDYAEIGPARGWWRQACENEPAAYNNACATYAGSLLSSGNAADRKTATEVLGTTCTPDSKTWRAECKGDATVGLEVCKFTYLTPQGAACVRLAATLPKSDSLRLYAAFCVGSLLPNANAVGEDACSKAAALAKKLGQSKTYQANVRDRTCEVEKMNCIEATFDLLACNAAKLKCQTRTP